MTRLASVLMLLLFATVARADAPTWAQLAPDEQRTLAPFASQWDSLAPDTRESLLRGAQR